MVNYDEENWSLLTENIMLLPPSTRAQLIGDSMELARAGLVDYYIPLKLISRVGVMDTEITFAPIIMAFDKISFIFNMLHSTEVYGPFEVSKHYGTQF